MPEWTEWKPCEGKKFPCLKQLFIKGCPKLIGTLPDNLHSLEELVIHGCREFVLPITNLPMLCELKVLECKEVLLGSYDDLWLVKRIYLKNIAKFTCTIKEMTKLESMKVETLTIDSCKELASLWQTKCGLLAPLRSLRNVTFRNFLQEVVCIGAFDKKEEIAEPLQLDIPCDIESLIIEGCKGLEKLSKTFHNLTCLTQVNIVGCPQLVSLSRHCLPPTLKRLEILSCKKLQRLVDDERESASFKSTSPQLENLYIGGCGSLKSISSSGTLPMRLKRLHVFMCPKLELVAQEVEDNTFLESIRIDKCENMKYLPQGLDKLSRLQAIEILCCPNLVCFPGSGLSTEASLTIVRLEGCDKLEALPNNLFSLLLQCLWIIGCPEVKYPNIISEPGEATGALLTMLTSLSLYEPNMSKAVVMEWGLHRFTSLTQLSIHGDSCTDVVSFPGMDTKLPSSLINLSLKNFKNLRKLSKGFQNLASLQSLIIQNCPKLKSLPKMELLPSLLELSMWNCPELEKMCKQDKGKQWSHLPCVRINGKFIYE